MCWNSTEYFHLFAFQSALKPFFAPKEKHYMIADKHRTSALLLEMSRWVTQSFSAKNVKKAEIYIKPRIITVKNTRRHHEFSRQPGARHLAYPGLVVCLCSKWLTRSNVSHDAWTINVNTGEIHVIIKLVLHKRSKNEYMSSNLSLLGSDLIHR
jgi:hypothetical protein